jgi:hypothetical protein
MISSTQTRYPIDVLARDILTTDDEDPQAAKLAVRVVPDEPRTDDVTVEYDGHWWLVSKVPLRNAQVAFAQGSLEDRTLHLRPCNEDPGTLAAISKLL